MYQYRGTVHDLDERVVPETPTEEFDSCGTMRGYRLHRRTGTITCPACKKAKRLQGRLEYATHRAKTPDATRPFDPVACGTHAGYTRHHYHRTPACDPCKAAFAEYHRDRRKRTRGAA